MNPRIANYYTIGRVKAAPTACIGTANNLFYTVRVEVFGSFEIDAITDNLELTAGMFVGVKITPKTKGLATYRVFEFNPEARRMISQAAYYLGGK